jgi:hypothetical protein
MLIFSVVVATLAVVSYIVCESNLIHWQSHLYCSMVKGISK